MEYLAGLRISSTLHLIQAALLTDEKGSRGCVSLRGGGAPRGDEVVAVASGSDRRGGGADRSRRQ
jgi:hypothetical protein